MASNRTQLTVEIITDATKAAQGLNDVAGKFSDFADKTRKAMAGAFAGAAIIGGIKEVISAASDLQQSVGGTDKVFGAFAQQIHTWAADTSDSIRLPQQAFEELATQMGVQLKSAGLPMAEVTTKVHDLMQASADLAAGMGKDLPDVANAVRSAFAGEYDALQNMGVAISDAVVQAEALKIAQATGAEATDAAVQAQAKYNVIMGGAATFTNQAAEETDTWAGRMDSLKEKLGNAAAAIGGPLLDSFGGLIDAVSESITVFQPFVETAARMVAAVAGLPPPLLAAAVAITAIGFAAGPIAGVLTTMAGAFVAVRGTMIGIQATAAIAGVSMSGMSAAMLTASAAARALGASLLAAIGGVPGLLIGAALTAVIGAVIGFVNASADAEAAAKRVEDGIKDMAAAAKAGATDIEFAETALKLLNQPDQFNGFKDGAELADQLGLSLGDLTSGMNGVPGAVDKVNAAFNEHISTLEGALEASRYYTESGQVQDEGIAHQIATLKDAQKVYGDLAQAKNEGIALSQAEAAAVAEATGQTQENVQATNDKAVADKEAEQAQKDLTAAIKTAQDAVNNTEMARAFDGVKQAADAAKQAVDYFALSIDKAIGRNQSFDETQAQWVSGLRDSTKAFADASEAGELNTQALTDWNAAALAGTDSGSKLFDTLSEQRSTYDQIAGSTFAAGLAQGDYASAVDATRAAATNARQSFLEMATAAGLPGDQAVALADKLGILDGIHIPDKFFTVVADAKTAQDALVALQQLGVDPKTITVTAQTDEAGNKIADIVQVAGQTVATIPVTADPAPAEGTIDSVTEPTRDTSKIQVQAEATPAMTVIKGIMGGTYPTKITLNGDSVPVNSTIRAVIGGSYSTTVHINGDSGPFNATMRAVLGSSASVSVRITADASQFYAVFNSLPTSKTITQQVVTVPAPAPPALMAGVSSLGRSRAGASPLQTNAPQQGNTIINVTGALDPDRVARQIESLLGARARRKTGVVIR